MDEVEDSLQSDDGNKVLEKMEDVSPAAQEPNHNIEDTEALPVRTDADIVKELVEMKFLDRNRIFQ